MTLRRAVKRLRLKPGDILILHPDLERQFFSKPIPGINFRVPIIFARNKNDIRRMTKQEVLDIADGL